MTRDPAPPRGRRPGRGLALIGYRGTGKSTVGRILACQSHRDFLDADLELEARAGRSVSAILTEDGEPDFRNWEERILAELIEESPTAVIATGGGAVVREANRRRLGDFGFIVWLTAEPGELACRLQSDPRGLAARPALSADGTIAEIARVLQIRKPLYQEVADVVIETGGKSPDQVAAAILECWLVSGP
jgi:shikimate kinase